MIHQYGFSIIAIVYLAILYMSCRMFYERGKKNGELIGYRKAVNRTMSDLNDIARSSYEENMERTLKQLNFLDDKEIME